MPKTANTIAIVIVFLLTIFALPLTAGADGGFSVTPAFPENQNPDTTGFFDLRVSPGQQQEIAIEIENTGNEEASFQLSLFAVGTNMNGIVDYTAAGQMDQTLPHLFTDIVSFPAATGQVTLPPGGKATVPIALNLPAEAFDGLMLGAVRVLRDITDSEREEGGMFINQFAHVIIVRLHQNDREIQTDFLLGDVRAENVAHRAAIVADIRNPMPRTAMGATANAQIYPAGQDTAIFTIADMNVDFAPSSIFPMTMMDNAGYGIQPGDYLARVQLSHEGRTWAFEQTFTVAAQQAAEINTAAVNQGQTQMAAGGSGAAMPTWMMLAIGAGAILLLVAVAFIARANKARRQEIAQLLEKIETEKKST